MRADRIFFAQWIGIISLLLGSAHASDDEEEPKLYFGEEKLSWRGARIACDGAWDGKTRDLAVIGNNRENKEVAWEIPMGTPQDEAVWIGLYSRVEEDGVTHGHNREWRWVPRAPGARWPKLKPNSFTAWTPMDEADPATDEDLCALYLKGPKKWQKRPCDEEHSFVCSVDPKQLKREEALKMVELMGIGMIATFSFCFCCGLVVTFPLFFPETVQACLARGQGQSSSTTTTTTTTIEFNTKTAGGNLVDPASPHASNHVVVNNVQQPAIMMQQQPMMIAQPQIIQPQPMYVMQQM